MSRKKYPAAGVRPGTGALRDVAAGILPAVEPGFQPGGQKRPNIPDAFERSHILAVTKALSGRQDAALYVRQDA